MDHARCRVVPAVREEGLTSGGPSATVCRGAAQSRTQPNGIVLSPGLDPPLKVDLASSEHPFFALKGGECRVRTYERNGVTITIKPGPDGMATMHDKDIWIYCLSRLCAAKNKGQSINRTVRFTARDFFRATGRGTSGREYDRLVQMLQRLSGTRIETNIQTNGVRERGFFGLIDAARVIERDGKNRMIAVEVTLPDWLFRSIENWKVLAIHREYFGLRKPIERRIYELARKHCGNQPHWRVGLLVLHQKSGSTSPLRNFREDICAFAESGRCPDYNIAYDRKRDLVTIYSYGPKARVAEARDMVAGRPTAPLSALEKMHAKKMRKRRSL
ncbi:replication initiator protein A [uncultured Sphingomonas sp.]|uniref:replication initiator protein A n=1 Tax=uncultured Sphingomonas sp. TaxID=158754 RepID=UPI0025FD9689|nr:replication initiator protein A [uncultured Sphingomonas sp.]